MQCGEMSKFKTFYSSDIKQDAGHPKVWGVKAIQEYAGCVCVTNSYEYCKNAHLSALQAVIYRCNEIGTEM